MNAPAMEELSRLRAIAEEGRSRPLLGGRHLILWGCAIILALLINWAVADRLVDWPGWSLAISWFGIILLAGVASAFLDRRKALEPGASSVGNKVERAAWVTTGTFLTILSLALLARAIAAGDPEAWQ